MVASGIGIQNQIVRLLDCQSQIFRTGDQSSRVREFGINETSLLLHRQGGAC